MLEDCDAVDIYATLKGATGGTLDVFVQASPDGGTTWFDVVHFAQLAAGAGTFNYKTTIAMYAQPASAEPVAVGTGLAPARAAATTAQCDGYERLRLVLLARAHTCADALQTSDVS